MITKITNMFYISGKETKEAVTHNKIDYCINISGVPTDYHVDQILSIADDYEKNSPERIIEILEAIDKQIKAGKRVLVMCHAGVSRSPAIAALYLFYSKAFDSYDEALQYVCSKSPVFRPNLNLVDFIKRNVIPKLKER